MTSKKSQLPARSETEQCRRERISSATERLLDELEETRRLYGVHRFGELDVALGRQPGFLNQVFKGRERLSQERLFAALDFLEFPADQFFAGLFPPEPVPSSPAGFLSKRKEKFRTQPRITFTSELLQWAYEVDLGFAGSDFKPDLHGLLRVFNVDSDRAFRMAGAALEGLLAIKPAVLTPQAGENLCRVLAPLAGILRHRGDRNSGCDLLDLAFHLERKLNDLNLRAYLFRTASYLLCDLAYLEEANYFAEKSTTLALLTADLVSIGRSMYLRALMLRRLGSPAKALPFLEACLSFFSEKDEASRVSARITLAYYRYELGEYPSAFAELEEIEQTLLARSGRVFARITLIRAEVASKVGELAKADRFFQTAKQEFAALGDSESLVLCGLEEMCHLLRSQRFAESNKLARQLLPLASQLKFNRLGQAILLEILRRSAQGELTLRFLEEGVLRWREPWRRTDDF